MPKEKQTLTRSDMETIGSVSDLVNANPTEEPTSFEIRPSEAEADKDLGTEHNAIRRKEAGDVLSWLSENGCLAFGCLNNALAALKRGDHRR